MIFSWLWFNFCSTVLNILKTNTILKIEKKTQSLRLRGIVEIIKNACIFEH